MTDIPRLVGRLLAHECSDPSECSEHEAAAALSEQQERIAVLTEALTKIANKHTLYSLEHIEIARAALGAKDVCSYFGPCTRYPGCDCPSATQGTQP